MLSEFLDNWLPWRLRRELAVCASQREVCARLHDEDVTAWDTLRTERDALQERFGPQMTFEENCLDGKSLMEAMEDIRAERDEARAKLRAWEDGSEQVYLNLHVALSLITSAPHRPSLDSLLGISEEAHRRFRQQSSALKETRAQCSEAQGANERLLAEREVHRTELASTRTRLSAALKAREYVAAAQEHMAEAAFALAPTPVRQEARD